MVFTQDTSGELFIRTVNGEIVPGHLFLKNIKNKYFNQDFNLELETSKILKFDSFLNSIFIETDSYFLIEKYYIDPSDNLPQPSNLYHNLFTKQFALIDYWYEEKFKKILISSLIKDGESFLLTIIQNSLENGQSIKILEENLNISGFPNEWDWSLVEIKSVKITYNTDSKMYNVSFLIKTLDRWGLISVLLYEDPDLKIKESKGVFLS